MFCSNCGNKLNEGAKFCKKCGTPAPVVNENQAYSGSSVQEKTPVTPPPVTYTKKRKGGSDSLWLYVALGMVLFVGVSAGLYFFKGGSEQQKPVDSAQTEMAKEEATSSGTYTVLRKTYFHTKADASTVCKAYLVEGQKFYVGKTSNGFGYGSFTNDKGKVTEGWLKMEDLAGSSASAKDGLDIKSIVPKENLEEAIFTTIKAIQSKSDEAINQLVHKDLGAAIWYEQETATYVGIADELSFDKIYYGSLSSTDFSFAFDYRIRFEELPKWDCNLVYNDELHCNWDKPSGIYCCQRQSLNLVKMQNMLIEMDISSADEESDKIKKMKKIERQTANYRDVMVVKPSDKPVTEEGFDSGVYIYFTLTSIDGKWYLIMVTHLELAFT